MAHKYVRKTQLMSLACSTLLFPSIVFSFEFTPIIAAIESSGNKIEQVYLFTNADNKPAAVRFKISTMNQRTDGSESNNPAENLFNITPKQAVIPTGGTQKIRVTWLGSDVKREQAYRFGARQLPIQLTQEGVSLKIISGMDGILYIKPPKLNKQNPSELVTTKTSTNSNVPQSTIANPDQTQTTAAMLKIDAVQAINTPQGKQLALTLTNPMDEHIILKNIQVNLISGNQSITLSHSQLGNMPMQNLLGRSSRNFIMPLPSGFDSSKQWQATIMDAKP